MNCDQEEGTKNNINNKMKKNNDLFPKGTIILILGPFKRYLFFLPKTNLELFMRMRFSLLRLKAKVIKRVW